MDMLKNAIAALLTEEEGQAMVEYPLIIALVSLAALAVMGTMGTNINSALKKAADSLGSVTGGTGQ